MGGEDVIPCVCARPRSSFPSPRRVFHPTPGRALLQHDATLPMQRRFETIGRCLVRTRSDPWGRCSFPWCRNGGERFVRFAPTRSPRSTILYYSLSSTTSSVMRAYKHKYIYAQKVSQSITWKNTVYEVRCSRNIARWRWRRIDEGERGSRRSIETSFHRATPYIAWENKSCGHSPGGRLDTGRCHRTRVAATATDRVREREDGYQWLHYTIPGGRERGEGGERELVCAWVNVNVSGETRTRRVHTTSSESRNQGTKPLVYIYIYVCKALDEVSPSSKKRERIWAARGSLRRVCALRKTTKPRAYDEKRLLHACGARSTLFPP